MPEHCSCGRPAVLPARCIRPAHLGPAVSSPWRARLKAALGSLRGPRDGRSIWLEALQRYGRTDPPLSRPWTQCARRPSAGCIPSTVPGARLGDFALGRGYQRFVQSVPPGFRLGSSTRPVPKARAGSPPMEGLALRRPRFPSGALVTARSTRLEATEARPPYLATAIYRRRARRPLAGFAAQTRHRCTSLAMPPSGAGAGARRCGRPAVLRGGRASGPFT